MKLKAGVSLQGVVWQLFEAAIKVESCYEALGHECVITSGTEGQHMNGSLHYKGKALDFRTRHVPVVQRQKLIKNIKSKLGPDYDVILEKDHAHIELDPK